MFEAAKLSATTMREDEQAASQVLTTMPQDADAGRLINRILPRSGTQASSIPMSQRLLWVCRIPSAAVQIVAIWRAPPGKPTSIVRNWLKPKPLMTRDENCDCLASAPEDRLAVLLPSESGTGCR